MINKITLFIRSLIFFLVYASFSTVFCLTAVFFIWWLPFNTQFNYLTQWNKCVIFFAKYLAGIKYEVDGLENIPKEGSFVVLVKHQSQWETFFLLLLFKPISIILKQELLNIPGFGWGLRLIKPIAIDRSNPKQALKQIQEEGKKRLLEDQLPILIFPEGTRITAGERGKYAKGGAALAINAGVPLLLVSHNAGYFWPADKFFKHAGTVKLFISKPIDTAGRTAKELTEEAEQWIESHVEVPPGR